MTVAAPIASRRKPKGEGHARRGEILEAAGRIFIEEGYEGATIRKIAEAVGISSTALYMHFSEKAEILHEITGEAFKALKADADRIAGDPADPETRLRRGLENYVAFAFANQNAYRLAYMTPPIEAAPMAQSAARELAADLYKGFEAAVKAVEETGRLHRDCRTTAQVLWAGVHGVISLMITKPYFDWIDRDTLVREMLDAQFLGLLKPA